jgi:hypothetical protein
MRSSLFVLGLFAVAACQSEANDDVGVISLAVAAAPAGAGCLRVTVSGESGDAVRTLGLTTGKATSGTLPGLPLGEVTVSAEALGSACSAVTAGSIPTWVSDPVPAFLTPGTAVPVQLVMRKAGQISVAVDWNTSSGGTGGTGGTGGSGGTPGKGGTGGIGGSAGGGDPTGVADSLNGQLMAAPCIRATGEATVCMLTATSCPAANTADPALSGVHMTDRSLTLGGNPGTTYAISLHVRGEVESKTYISAGPDQSSAGQSPRLDGFYPGGRPTSGDAYSVWMIRVTNPDGTKNDYFLNSLAPPGVSNHTTYGVDYNATIRAQGGAVVRLVAADANCSMIKNCGPTTDTSCLAPIVISDVDPVVKERNPTFNFNGAYDGQWLSLAVNSVTPL